MIDHWRHSNALSFVFCHCLSMLHTYSKLHVWACFSRFAVRPAVSGVYRIIVVLFCVSSIISREGNFHQLPAKKLAGCSFSWQGCSTFSPDSV